MSNKNKTTEPCAEPVKNNSVHDQLNSLEGNINDIHDELNRLHERLAFVMEPSTPKSSGEKEGKEEDLSPLASKLRDLNYRLIMVDDRLRYFRLNLAI